MSPGVHRKFRFEDVKRPNALLRCLRIFSAKFPSGLPSRAIPAWLASRWNRSCLSSSVCFGLSAAAVSSLMRCSRRSTVFFLKSLSTFDAAASRAPNLRGQALGPVVAGDFMRSIAARISRISVESSTRSSA